MRKNKKQITVTELKLIKYVLPYQFKKTLAHIELARKQENKV